METIKALTGKNRTGVARAKERCEEMLRGNHEFAPPILADGASIAALRKEYASEGEPLGTLPPPASAQQLGNAAVAALRAGHPAVFVDKLAARLAFERSGVRLYEALLSKFDALGGFDSGPQRADLELLLQQEMAHFMILHNAIEKLGADPTAMTPAADVEATASLGLQALVLDPRTSMAQALEAMLIVELADNEMWDTLVQLATESGQSELGSRFAEARDEEREHLSKVRAWVAASIDAA
jgi:rubrerythrin